MNGLQSIRAFGAQDEQLAAFVGFTNKNLSTFFNFFAVSRWLSVRLDTVTSFLVFFMALFAAVFRGTISAGLLGVALAQGLQVHCSFQRASFFF